MIMYRVIRRPFRSNREIIIDDYIDKNDAEECASQWRWSDDHYMDTIWIEEIERSAVT